jgi:hypothetical protein
LKWDRPIGVGQTGCTPGGFVSAGKPGAVLLAGTAVPSPKARQTGSPRARGVGPGSWRGWGGSCELYGGVGFVRTGGEAARRWRGVLGGPGDTPVSNCGHVNVRQGKTRAGPERLP